MKQERRKAGGQDRDPEQRDQKREIAREPVRDTVVDEPVRRLDGPAIDDSFRGKSDGEILQRYEF
jgi:hypothetical protein